MEDLYCPACNSYIEPGKTWDYIDGEERRIRCPTCNKPLKITILRPIEYHIEELG